MSGTGAGFPPDAIGFLQDLSRNNDRAWFKDHRDRFEGALRGPAEPFLDTLAAALEAETGRPFAGKIFKIHRDIRFSRDKTPYNVHLRLALWATQPESRPAEDRPGFYLSLEPAALTVGTGLFGFSKPMLETYRAAILDDVEGARLANAIDGLTKAGMRLHPPELKRVPAGIDPSHGRADLLRRKSLAVWSNLPAEAAIGPEAAGRCVDRFRAVMPVYAFLDALDDPES